MKDYYRTLGVLDDAEDIIIRAAYKALAQRYHPDKWKGDPQEANKRMSDINEAYDVLSDSAKRKKYDEEYFRYRARDESTEEDESEANFISEEDENWQMAIDFYPIILREFNELKKISDILANTYKTNLINSQDFKQSTKIKYKYEKEYLSRFYGDNNEIKEFAKKLLLNNHKKAAIKVNKIVRLMGDSVDFIQLYKKIIQEFPEVVKSSGNHKSSKATTSTFSSSYDSQFHEIFARAKQSNISESEAIYLIKKVHGKDVKVSGFGWTNKYLFTLGGIKYSLSLSELKEYIKENL